NRNSQEEKLQIFSLNIDADKTIDGKKLLYYGTEWVFNDISSVAWITNISTWVKTPAGPRYPDGSNRFSSYSVYGGYKNPVSESFTLNAGLRYNYVTLNSTISDNSWYSFPFTSISIANGAMTGSVGIVKKITEQADITANLSTGFRAPNLDDAGKVFESTPGVVVVPNPGLRSEYAWNADLGISKNFGRFLHSEINGFITLLDNAMVRRDFLFNGDDSIEYRGQLSKVEAVVNAGRGIVYGIQLNILANITRDIRLKSTLNITDGMDQDHIPLRHVAPLFGNTHITFERPRLKADLYAVYNGPKPFDKMSPSEAEKPYMYAEDEKGKPFSPGWVTLNAKVSYNFGNWVMMNAGVENILDHGYRTYSSGIVAPGRNFILSLRVTV
ncbi:MAG: TonB-dependent receptor, partial [Bacteroidetes bacterium]|nr:TonB-dependent receptor [Bacteroidota bacterium]